MEDDPSAPDDTSDMCTADDFRAAFETILDASAGLAVGPVELSSAFGTALHPVFLAIQKGSEGLLEDDNVTVNTLGRMICRVSKIKHLLNAAKNRKAGHENHRERWTPEESEELEEALKEHGVPVVFPNRSPDSIKFELNRIFGRKYSGNAEYVKKEFPNLTTENIQGFLLPNHRGKKRRTLE